MILKNFLRLLKVNIFHTFATVFLLSFLIFFLNILLGLTANIYTFSKDVKNKLGVYLYFKEGNNSSDIQKTYSLIIDMKSKLENAGLKVKFYSKEQGLETLSKRLPKIIQNFEKYGIKNPIPPTLYIIFNSEQQYKTMRQIVLDPKYSEIILNLSDVGSEFSFKSQEKRVSQVIEFSNFLIRFYIFLSVILLLIILWFVMLILKLSFYSFYSQIEVEKLLGFSFFQIKIPFLLYAMFLIVMSMIFGYSYMWILIGYLNRYFENVFNVNLYGMILNNLHYIKIGLLTETAVLILISLIISNIFLGRLIKKI